MEDVSTSSVGEATVRPGRFPRSYLTRRSYLGTARAVGVLFIVGTVSGIVSGTIVAPYLTPASAAPQYLSQLSTGGIQMQLGAFFVFLMGLSLALIPVLLYPLLKRYSEPVAVGYLVFRAAIEFVLYLSIVGILLTILAIGRESTITGASAAGAYDSILALLAGYDVVYGVLLTLVFALGALFLYVALYRTALIPRWLAAWGLLAALLWLVWGGVGLFGLVDPAATVQVGVSLPVESVFALPIALQEMVMALWLLVRGFDGEAVDALGSAEAVSVR